MPLGHDQQTALDMVNSHQNIGRLGRAALFVGLISMALLAGCTTSGSRAPVSDLNSSQSLPSGKTYTVKAGDTLNKIARANGTDEGTLIRLNKLANPNKLEVGQVLRLNEGADTSSGAKPSATGKRPEPRATESDPSQPPSRASDSTVINWGWPAKGNVVQPFTTASKGIDIAGNAGDTVEAAASGKVVYSGNGLRGYGNLVILDHGNGFVTAYAHNRSISVKKDQDVKKGAKIAEMGQTDSTSVKLHFEIRRQGTPVDPLQYLPAK